LENFINWVSDPISYNWITLLAAASSLLAAIFTGYSAYLSWRASRPFHRAEWHHELYGDAINLSCQVFNETDQTLELEFVRVKGPVANVLCENAGRTNEKHKSWGPTKAPCSEACPPKKSVTVRFVINPDAQLLRASAKSLIQRFWLLWAKLLWRFAEWRVPAGPKFSVTLVARKRSSKLRPVHFTHKMRIYPAQAISMAGKIDEKSSKENIGKF
jgi:hypothetical protein